jgi:DNA-binding MarR family transcriptional regulator
MASMRRSSTSPSSFRSGVLVPPARDPLETSLLFDVFALNQAVGRMLADAMDGGPLTPSEYAVYSAIFELEAASPTELARRLAMRLTTFIDQLRSIEARGHARRLPHPTDRRSYRVVLTAPGLAAHRAAAVMFEAAAVRFAASLGDGERGASARLRALRVAADAARLEPVSRHPRGDRGG